MHGTEMSTAHQKIKTPAVDTTAAGYYTAREATRLLGLKQPAKLVAWLQGHRNSKSGPIIARDRSPVFGSQELSFLDLMELRFVEHFRRQGVSLPALRKAAETLRKMQRQSHPFATSQAKFMTDRKSVFFATAQELKDQVLLNLVTHQYAMYVIYEDALSNGVDFHPSTGLARVWQPYPLEFPRIALNPLISFGQPVVLPFGIPTATIFSALKAENGDTAAVAAEFRIAEELVKEAVAFELRLPN